MKVDKKTPSRHSVSNLLRGLDIMELLLESPEGLGVSDISRALGIPVNAAFRISSALVERGYLLKDDQTKAFTLSARLVTMGYRMGNRNGLVETAMPLMRELRDVVKETVILCVMAGGDCIALDSVPGLHMFRFTVDPGTTASLHASAPGKALPQSIWYHTDADVVGFRVVRPLRVPSAEEAARYDLDRPQIDATAEYMKAKRK